MGTLVNLANLNQQDRQALLRTVDAQREQISRLLAETQRLEGELKQAKLELKLERQGKFATHQQEQSETSAAETVPPPVTKQGRKRGAPVGHPGWFRPTPAEYDWMVEVPAPGHCPLCGGAVTVQPDLEPLDHLQGRIIQHRAEWLVFVDDPRVPPTNNLAKRALRPLVVLRKLTFGHRSRSGGERMAKLMTVAETARRHGHRASQIFLELHTHPPNHVLRRLYARK